MNRLSFLRSLLAAVAAVPLGVMAAKKSDEPLAFRIKNPGEYESAEIRRGYFRPQYHALGTQVSGVHFVPDEASVISVIRTEPSFEEWSENGGPVPPGRYWYRCNVISGGEPYEAFTIPGP